MLIGLAAIVLANLLIKRRPAPGIADLRGASARKALLLLGVMTAHSFAEGVGVGVAFGGAGDLGLSITAAIAIHNIPRRPGHLSGADPASGTSGRRRLRFGASSRACRSR